MQQVHSPRYFSLKEKTLPHLSSKIFTMLLVRLRLPNSPSECIYVFRLKTEQPTSKLGLLNYTLNVIYCTSIFLKSSFYGTLKFKLELVINMLVNYGNTVFYV